MPSSVKSYQLGLGAVATSTESTDDTGQTTRKFLDAGQNPPGGVRVHYWLADEPEGEITLSFLDKDGGEIKTFTSAKPDKDADDGPAEPRLTKSSGLNRFDWNTRYADAHKVSGDKTTAGALIGPKAPPGSYSVGLTVGDQAQTEQFDLVKDPRVAASQEDLDAQFAMLLTLRDKLSETHDNINRLRSVKHQVTEWSKRAAGGTAAESIASAAETLNKKLSDIEAILIQTEYKGARDRLTLPVRLNGKLAGLIPVVAVGDYAPPAQTRDVFQVYSERLDAQFQALEKVIDEDMAQFDNLVHELEVPAIVPRASE
jgi:hypothetical protein